MGPVAMDSNGGRIGEFAYAVLADPKDFSLIRLDPQVPATPAMCAFRGPTGINSDQPEITQIVMLNYYGSGIGLGSTFPARSALTVGMPNPDYVFAEGVAVPGDSGSGVMSSDGRAVGVLVATGVHKGSVSTSGAGAGTMGITRLQPQLDRAQTALGIFFTLQLAPLQ
jgi:hypothetical protein